MSELSDVNVTAMLPELVREWLQVKRVSMIHGGPSPSDPMGEIERYMGFVDTADNSLWFGVSINGHIVKGGCTIHGKSYKFQLAEEEIK